MANHDYVVDNGPGLAVRTDINAVLQAIVTQNSGPVEPTTKYPGMVWLDLSVPPDGVLKMRNQANTAWVSLGSAGLAFTDADLSFGARTGPNRFVWNDKVDGTGADIMALTETGALSVLGTSLACYRLNGGSLSAAQASLDITLPAGYLSHEILLNGFAPVTDAQAPVLRMSNDGTTFIATGYSYALNVTTMAAANVPAGAAAATYIQLSLPQSNNVGARGSLRITLPGTAGATVNTVPYVFWDGGYYSGTNYGRVDGAGVLTTGIPNQAKAVRILYGAGNIQPGLVWQLNGYK